MDFSLDGSGDLEVTEGGDILLTDSIKQHVQTRLQWILGEWRLNPDIGFPYFENVMVKNRDFEMIQQLIISEAMMVPGVLNCEILTVDADPETRIATVRFICTTEEETFENEVILYG